MLQDVFSSWVQTHKTFKTFLVWLSVFRQKLYILLMTICTIVEVSLTESMHCPQLFINISKMNIKPDLLSRPTSPSRTGLDAPREKNAVWPLRTLLALVRGGSCFCTHIIIFNCVKNWSIFWMFAQLTISLQAFTIWQRKSTTRKNDLMLFP